MIKITLWRSLSVSFLHEELREISFLFVYLDTEFREPVLVLEIEHKQSLDTCV